MGHSKKLAEWLDIPPEEAFCYYYYYYYYPPPLLPTTNYQGEAPTITTTRKLQ